MKGRGTLVFALFTLAATSAAAQESTRFFTINGGYQSSAKTVTGTQVFSKYDEDGETATSYRRAPRGMVDLGLGMRVRRKVVVGAVVSWSAAGESADIVGKVPHPLFVSQIRTGTASATLRHSEVALHLQAHWIIPLPKAMDLTVAAGPSIFRVAQEVVTGGAQDPEVGAPYDKVKIAPLTTETRRKVAAGFNVGIDIVRMFTARWGAGLAVRYTHAKADVGKDPSSIELEAGGVQAGLGLRMRF